MTEGTTCLAKFRIRLSNDAERLLLQNTMSWQCGEGRYSS